MGRGYCAPSRATLVLRRTLGRMSPHGQPSLQPLTVGKPRHSHILATGLVTRNFYARAHVYGTHLCSYPRRFFVLSQTDSLWKEHLQAIKFLQQAVGLRGYASKDPLTEFKLEGYNLFVDMTAQIRRCAGRGTRAAEGAR